MDEGTSWGFPTDVLVEILLRLPASARRRSRLVCRHWRDAVDTRTTEMQSRAKTLVVTSKSAYVFDDLSTGRCRELWTGDVARRYEGMSMVGTCNGLICLCDNRKPGGAVTLANPVTGETLAVPPLPLRYKNGDRSWHQTYSFTYHLTTGLYKVVHVPYYVDQVWVFVLGEASWWGVATACPDDICDRDAGIVSIDGVTYWAVQGTKAKVMSFDLDAERVTSIRSLPSVLSRSRPGTWHLTEVGGRLGIAFSHVSPTLKKTEAWVMEGATGEQQRWSRWYSVQMRRARHQQHLSTGLHFIHGGEHVLTWEWSPYSNGTGGYVLYRHRPSDDTRKARRGVVEISERNREKVVAHIEAGYKTFRTFAYVETTEPLSAYRCW